jgi:hypothetical protein
VCVSLRPAEFSGTVLYGGRRTHPRLGPIEVLGYQNTAVNLADGPNAMVLHIPSPDLSQRHFVPVGRSTDVLTRMRDAVLPPFDTGAGSDIAWPVAAPVEVFQHDIYTVVLARDPTRIPAALDQVPTRRRPSVSAELCQFYADVFPHHTIALCCFDTTRATVATPLLLWYPPPDPDRIVLPALDCHTGAVPDPDAWVHPDHVLVFGTDDAEPGWGTPVEYGRGTQEELREFLPESVRGIEQSYGRQRNGDFAIGYDDLLAGELMRVDRIRPGR